MGITGQAIRAGRAFVEIGAKDKLTGDLGRIRGKLNSFALSVGKIGLAMGAFAGGLGIGIFGPAIKSASDYQEALNAFKQTFAELSDASLQWATDFARMVGRSKRETLEGMMAFQSIYKGLGFSNEQAAQLSKQMHTLAVDFGSFRNLSDQEALQRFIAGLSGSGEVFDRFGINIKQAALDVKLVEMGFKKVAQGATEMQKVLARTEIIKETMKELGMEGDALRTKFFFANQLKVLKGEFDNLKVAIGDGILPIVIPLIRSLNSLVIGITRLVEANKWLGGAAFIVTAAIGGIGVALVLLAGGVALVSFAIGSFATLFSFIAGIIAVVGAPVLVLVGGLALLAAAFVAAGLAIFTLFGGWSKLSAMMKVWWGQLQGAAAVTASSFDWLLNKIRAIWQGIKDAVSGGSLELAAQIAMIGLASAVLEALNPIAQGFRNTLEAIKNVVVAWVKGVIGLFFDMAQGALKSLEFLAQQLPFSGVAKTALAGLQLGLGKVEEVAKGAAEGVGELAMAPFNAAAGALDAANAGLMAGLDAKLAEAKALAAAAAPDPDNAAKYMAEKNALELAGSSRGTFSGAAAKIIAGTRDGIPKKQLNALIENKMEIIKLQKIMRKNGWNWN